MPRLFHAGAKLGASATARRRCLLALGEQTLLAAHLGEVAKVDRGRPRRLAGLAHVRDGEIEIAERIGHEAEEISGVRLSRPHRQHLPAGHLCFVGATGGPSGAGALDSLCDGFGVEGNWHLVLRQSNVGIVRGRFEDVTVAPA